MYEQKMDGNDLIDMLEEIANVSLTDEQRKQLNNVIADLPEKTPEAIAKAIRDELQRIANITLSDLEWESLVIGSRSPRDARSVRRNKWQLLHEKELQREREEARNEGPAAKPSELQKQVELKGKQFNDDQINSVMLAAANKLNIKLDSKELKEANEYFQENTKPGESEVDQANTALLGVISVHFTSPIRPVIFHNWGNLLGITDYNQYDGEAMIDSANKFDTSLAGDPLGTEFRLLVNYLQQGVINQDVLRKLEGITGTPIMGAETPVEEAGTSGIYKTARPKLSMMTDPTDPFDS